MIMDFLVRLLNYYRDVMALKNPVIYAGMGMIGLAFGGQGLILLSGSILLKDEMPFLKGVELVATNQNDLVNWGSLLLIVAGIFFVWLGVKNVKKDVQPIYIRGLPGQREEFPEELLVGPDKMKDMGAHRFGVVSNDPAAIVENVIDDKKTIQKHTLHSGARKIYLAGIARIPALVAYGTAFSNAHAEIVHTDHGHKGAEWYRLDKLTFEEKLVRLKGLDELRSNEAGQIGIAIGFSADVFEESLPKELQGHTFHYSLLGKTEKNAFGSSVDLVAAVDAIVSDVEKLRIQAKEFHFFISAQTAFPLELGRRYQTGIHSKWVIHNFDGKTQSYTWKVEILGDNIQLAA